MQYFEGEHR